MFKNFLLTIATLLTLSFISGCANSSSSVVANEKSNDKIYLYIIKRDGCPACEYQKRVMRVKEVKALLDSDCIVNYIDINDQNKLPAEWMHTNTTPTVHFLDRNNRKLINSIGSVQPYQFRDAILKAKSALH